FRIKEYLGSYDNSLMCRHVHSINEHVGGLIVATGEEYPEAWLLYITQYFKDASTVVNALNIGRSNVFRLNSSPLGLQRACGVLMDNEDDPNLIFNSDTSYVTTIGKWGIEGRSPENLPRVSSNGVWRGRLSDIDDWSKFKCVLPVAEPAIWTYNVGDVIVSYYQLGGNAVSVDGGNTWDYYPKGASRINGIYNNRIVIGDGYKFEWK